MFMAASLCIVANFAPIHIGAHVRQAAESLHLDFTTFDIRPAYEGSSFFRKLNWWLRGRRPNRMAAFEKNLLEFCKQKRPRLIYGLGLIPVSGKILAGISQLGIQTSVFLTDDPWNRAHYAPWFFEALPKYDFVFTPREETLPELLQAGARSVHYLPFGFSPNVHFREKNITSEDHGRFDCDVAFAGGADADRVPYIQALVKAGLRVKVYGGYWERVPFARAIWGGHLEAPEMRKAIACAKTVLCLVRRANRDGHAMRTFEVAAMGGCMVAEDTPDHRKFLGPAARYFTSIEEMTMAVRFLVSNEPARNEISALAHQRIFQGPHSYADRLKTLFQIAQKPLKDSSFRPSDTRQISL